MELLITSIIVFILIYTLYYFLIIKRDKNLEKFRTSKEVLYLEYQYNINIDKIDKKVLAKNLSLANSIIITITFFISELTDNMWLKLIIMFVVLIILILVIYHFIGRYYIRKYGRKRKKK